MIFCYCFFLWFSKQISSVLAAHCNIIIQNVYMQVHVVLLYQAVLNVTDRGSIDSRMTEQ